jgi:hypothetical protein
MYDLHAFTPYLSAGLDRPDDSPSMEVGGINPSQLSKCKHPSHLNMNLPGSDEAAEIRSLQSTAASNPATH